MVDLAKIRKGMAVRDVDGQSLGRIAQRGASCFLITSGHLVRERLIVDDDCVRDVLEHEVHLSVGRQFLLQRQTLEEGDPPIAFEPDSNDAPN